MRLLVLVGMLVCISAAARATTALTLETDPDPCFHISDMDPKEYVRILEVRKHKKIVLYDPRIPELRSQELRANNDSKILVQILKYELPCNSALGGVHVRARLDRHEGEDVELAVGNYRELGTDEDDEPTQEGLALKSLENTTAAVLNLFNLVEEILTSSESSECAPSCVDAVRHTAERRYTDPMAGDEGETRFDFPSECIADQAYACEERLKLLGQLAVAEKARIEQLAQTFRSNSNHAVSAFISNQIFQRDLGSFQVDVGDFIAAITTLASGQEDDRNAARLTVYRDAVGVYLRFYEHFHKTRTQLGLARDEFSRDDYRQVLQNLFIQSLRGNILDGEIALPSQDAKNRDTLLLWVRAHDNESDVDESGDYTFRVKLRNFGVHLNLTDSLLFIKRMGVSEDDEVTELAGEMGENDGDETVQQVTGAVRFVPAAGISCGISWRPRALRRYIGRLKHARENEPTASTLSKSQKRVRDGRDEEEYFIDRALVSTRPAGPWTKLGEALTPGIGLNVSFLDFGDIDGITRDSINEGNPFEVGVGPIVTLFDNKVQIAYGYNLQARRKKQYWALGFNVIGTARSLINRIGQ